jgi:hypothetical protein
MPSIRIQDKIQRASGSFLDVYLKDILSAIGEPVLTSRWVCRDLWCVRSRDGVPQELREKRLKFSGEEIMLFASNAGQVIDGRFEARGQGAAKRPWLIIVAFDSTFYDVWSSKPNVIERIKERYNDVSDIPNIIQNLK